ncbi:MAG: PT domain-containing protein [Bacilli bacterium]|nr:PT domain-containing protein [Bacilli bacterium]
MINNKKLILAALLSASMILAGCDGGTPASQPTSQPASQPTSQPTSQTSAEPTADVPTEAGKTTFYIEVASDSIALPTWCSYFLTGCMNGWATTPSGGVIELQNLANTNIYYAIVAGYDDEANAADRGYQVTMGYNASSQLGDASQGINWSYKGKSNASFSGLDHPTFDAPVDGIVHITAKWSDDTVDEAGFKWDAALPEPVTVDNYTVKFTVDPTLKTLVDAWNSEKGASGVTGYAVKGTHNDWSWKALKAEEDGSYTFTVDKIICGVTYEMCVAPLTAAGVDGDAYNLTGTGVKAADTTDEDGTYHIGNFSFTPLALDGDDYVATWGALKAPEKASGEIDTAYALPSATKLDHTITIRVYDIENGTGLGEGKHLYVAGSWNGWGLGDNDANIMTENEGVYSYEITADIYVGVALEFGIISNSTWAGKLSAEGGANFKIIPEVNKTKFDIVGDLSKNGVEDSVGTYDYHGDFVNGIVITVSDIEGGTGLGEGKHLYVAGSWNGWGLGDNDANIMTENEGVYTYTIADNTATIGAKLEFGIISNSSWAGKLSAEGGANFSFTVEAGKLHVNIVGDLAKNGVENSVGTLAYVA